MLTPRPGGTNPGGSPPGFGRVRQHVVERHNTWFGLGDPAFKRPRGTVHEWVLGRTRPGPCFGRFDTNTWSPKLPKTNGTGSRDWRTIQADSHAMIVVYHINTSSTVCQAGV